MLKNYLKIAFRSLWKNKGYSAINIFGLAIGLATCLMILLYVTDELSYDKHHVKADRIYRVNSDILFGGTQLKLAVSSDPMGPTLKKDYPQVEEYTRVYASNGSKLIKKGSSYINEPAVCHADSTFFNVFTFPSIFGDTRNALNEPNTVVVTETAAKKYFNSAEAAMGQTLDVSGEGLFKVTAVIKDMPKNAHFNFDFLFSMDNVDYNMGNFLSHNFHTYVVLKPGATARDIEKHFPEFLTRYIVPQASQLMDIKSMDEFEKSGNKLEYHLMPVTDIHLRSDRFPELGVNGNIQYVYIFSAVAIFILLIACINFMNLSTARSANRAKEVGIRKVLGTERSTLIRQFLTESLIVSLISFAIAIVVAWSALPYFNSIANKSLTIASLLTIRILPFLILLPVAVGLLAGSYPAFYLSAFKPITVLKGKVNAGFKRSNLRNSLVVFQFAVSIFLMVGTLVVYKQLNFIQNTKLGYSKDQVLIINGTHVLGSNATAFKNEVLGMQGVKMGTISGYLPVASSSRSDNTYSKEATIDAKSGFNMQGWSVDEDYIPTMGMEVVKGRNFSREYGTDSSGIIINEAAADVLGFPDPIGRKIHTIGQDNQPVSYNIIGVVKNFHFESLRQKVTPLSLTLGESRGMTSFKVNTTNIQELVKQIEAKWKAMSPANPFSYRFLDDAFDGMYRDEQRVGRIAITFAGLAIFIACLGLLGLVTYAAEQRTKEIGIRKVLGASAGNIIGMLSKDFLRLVLVASIIAIPFSWWAMRSWLQDFAYRVPLSWWIFMLAGVVAVLIALATIFLQALKAAVVNPVDSLKDA